MEGKSFAIAKWIIGIPTMILILVAAYVWVMLTWSYSEGERAGYVQKFSKKGWIFKTWEGELTMVTQPGFVPEKFYFSVREDSVVQQINEVMGDRVALHYEQHVGLPINWFGETEHFVVGVRIIE